MLLIRALACCIITSFLGGCLYAGISEPDYFKGVVDKSELKERTDHTGFHFPLGEFYQSHRQSIVSSEGTTGVNINYVETGDKSKPAVLFVHGTPGRWKDFWKFLVVNELKQKAHLVSIDRPGWGDSSCITQNSQDCFSPLLKQQSEYLNTLLERLDEQNNHQGVILVGWSLGGPLIGQMAFDYPKYIKGLVFIAGPFDPSLAKPRWYNRFSQVFSWVVPDILLKSNVEMMPLSSELTEMKDQWQSINVPVWVIQGSKDDLVDRENIDYARKLFVGKEAQFIEIETSGHFVHFEKMSMVVESINQALEKLENNEKNP